MGHESCCTCARYISNIVPAYDEKTEKPIAQDRRLDCCGRIICGNCITDNLRFLTYCPFCQISTAPTALPQGLTEPPQYSPPPSLRPSLASLAVPIGNDDPPPSYSGLGPLEPPIDSKPLAATEAPAPDVLHFIHPDDTLASISLAYGVPVLALRRTNGLFSDNLLAARKTLLIPGEYYKGGVSLSPRPVEGEEEEVRRNKIRRWMVSCKVSEYDVAVLYLQQADYDLAMAIEAFKADEQWEKDHPMEANVKGKAKAQDKGRRRVGGGGLTGRLSGGNMY